MGLTDSLECSFSCHDQRSVTELDLYSEPLSRGLVGSIAGPIQRTTEQGAGGEHRWTYTANL